MIDEFGDAALVWSVRLAVLSYLLGIVTLLRNHASDRVPTRSECLFWTLGCLAYLTHVVLAFEYRHDWSHQSAWQHTATETERMIGIRRGDGIWVNYLFTLIWIVDAARLVTARARGRETNRIVDLTIHTLFAFIIFNATVVFGPALYRWLAAPVAIALTVLAVQRRQRATNA